MHYFVIPRRLVSRFTRFIFLLRYFKAFSVLRYALAVKSLPVQLSCKHSSNPRLCVPTRFYLRRGTTDLIAYHKVFGKSEYDFEGLESVSNVIDAGANIGCSAVFFALKYPNANIYALEPERHNLELLHLNIKPYGRIHVIDAALANSQGCFALDVSTESDAHSIRKASSTLNIVASAQHFEAHMIETVTISSLMLDKAIPRVDLLKIDIEGGEVDVLDGKASWIACVGAIAIEPHSFAEGSLRACADLKEDFKIHITNGENHIFLQPINPHNPPLDLHYSNKNTTTRPTLAVCIPTFNQCTYLAECLDSVFSQTLFPDEVWISDDASTDETYATVRELQKRYPNIRYIRQPVRLGMSGNPRWVVQQPKTDFIAKLDSDDKYKPKYLERLMALLEAYPSAGYAHSDVDFINGKSEIFETRRLCRHNVYVDSSSSLLSHTKGFKVSANIILYRRKALEEVDFFSRDLSFCDDWDIGIRLADKGWGNVHSCEVLAYYRVWNDSKGYRSRRILDRIESVVSVYENSLIPAFSKRDWPTYLVAKARLHMATHLATRPEIKLLDSAGQARAWVLLNQLGMCSVNTAVDNDIQLRIRAKFHQLQAIVKALARKQLIRSYRRKK